MDMPSFNLSQLENMKHLLLLIFAKVDQNSAINLLRTCKWVNTLLMRCPNTLFAKFDEINVVLNDRESLYIQDAIRCRAMKVSLTDARLFKIRAHKLEIMGSSNFADLDNEAVDCLVNVIRHIKLTSTWLGFSFSRISCSSDKFLQLRKVTHSTSANLSLIVWPTESGQLFQGFQRILLSSTYVLTSHVVKPEYLENLNVPTVYIEFINQTAVINRILKKWIAGRRALEYLYIGEMICIPRELVANLSATLIYSENTHRSSSLAKYKNISGKNLAYWIWTIKQDETVGGQEKVIWWNSMTKTLIVKDLTTDPMKTLESWVQIDQRMDRRSLRVRTSGKVRKTRPRY